MSQEINLIKNVKLIGIALFLLGLLTDSDHKESACNEGDRVRSLGREGLLEKRMATPSRILAWRIPWTEEPGGL